MEFFTEFFTNRILWVSVFSCFLAQFFKIFTGTNRIDIGRILISGGMPSSHSSFVSCMSTMVGMKYGFNSDFFAVCMIFSCIIMYDASGVRQAVGKQAILLNQMVDSWQHNKTFEQEKLKELIGHTPKQVILGCILGIIIGLIF